MKKNTIINVAIADEYPIYRTGLVNAIRSKEELQLVFEVDSVAGLMEKLDNAELFPDVCIMDLSKNEQENYDVISKIKHKWIDLKILAMSMFSTEFSIIRMINLGVNGFLSKKCELGEIYDAVESLYTKDYYYSATIPEVVFRKAKASVLMKITSREMEFLTLCCSDVGYKYIADQMGISVRTIESYRNSLYDKLHVKSRMGLMIFALKTGIFPAEKLRQTIGKF